MAAISQREDTHTNTLTHTSIRALSLYPFSTQGLCVSPACPALPWQAAVTLLWLFMCSLHTGQPTSTARTHTVPVFVSLCVCAVSIFFFLPLNSAFFSTSKWAIADHLEGVCNWTSKNFHSLTLFSYLKRKRDRSTSTRWSFQLHHLCPFANFCLTIFSKILPFYQRNNRAETKHLIKIQIFNALKK